MLVGTDDRIAFLRRVTGHGIGDWSPGGHDQGTVGAGENRAEHLNHKPIVLAVLDESRKVMVEGEMDDAIRSSGAVLEAVRVRDRPAIEFGPCSGQSRRFILRAAEADHLMAGPD